VRAVLPRWKHQVTVKLAHHVQANGSTTLFSSGHTSSLQVYLVRRGPALLHKVVRLVADMQMYPAGPPREWPPEAYHSGVEGVVIVVTHCWRVCRG
jgi:hypothetical protein